MDTRVDSTTQPTYFLKGLKKLIVFKLEGMISSDVMQDVDKLIDAAKKVEADIDMSIKPRGRTRNSPRMKGHMVKAAVKLTMLTAIEVATDTDQHPTPLMAVVVVLP